MSIASKAVLINNLQKQFSAVMTADCMTQAMRIVSDQLEQFNVEQTSADGVDMSDFLDAYLSSLRVEGKSELTIARYDYIISRMMRDVGVPTRSITVYHLRKYLADEKSRGLSDRTMESNRQVYNAYFNWLQRECLITANPTANLGAIKYQKKLKSIYSDIDIERLKNACVKKRDKAIVCFLYATGCRISEMCGLNRDNVDLNSLECVVLGKGNKERTVFLDPVAGMTLQEYLESRVDSDPALFMGTRGRLTLDGVRHVLKALQKNTSVNHVHPHKFRRTRATRLIQHGMPIQEVAAILGHEKLDTTMGYVVMNKIDIKNSYRKFM